MKHAGRWNTTARRSRRILVAAAIMAASGAALASTTIPPLIDVNFYDTSTSSLDANQASGAAVIGTSTDQWNQIGAPGELSNEASATNSISSSGISLTTSTGAASGVSLGYSSQLSAYSVTQGSLDPGLMDQYFAAKGSNSTNITLSGLQANTVYDLYVYTASFDASNNSRATVVTANGASADATGNAASSFVQGDNYVLLTPMSSSSGVITIAQTLQPGSSEGDLNGLQIQSAVDTFTQNNHNSDSTGTNFWSNAGNWNTGVPAGSTSVAVIPAANSSGAYNADLNGTSQTVIGVNLGAGSDIYNSGSSAETLTISPGSSGYNSDIAGNIGSTTGTLPGASGDSGGSGGGAVQLVILGGNNTVSGLLFGNLSLVVDGGTTTLSDTTNNYTGGTTLDSGTLAINSASAIGSGAVSFNGGTLQTTASISSLTNIFTIGGGGGTIDADGNSVTLNNIISGSGSLTIESSATGGVVTLGGANAYAGGTIVESGTTLAISADDNLGTASANLDLFNHSTLSVNGSFSMSRQINLTPGADEKIDVASGNTLTDNGIISGLFLAGPASITNGPVITAGPASAETLEISGPGTLVLNGANTYTGGTTIDSGSTAIAGNDSAFGSGSITNAGTLATSNYIFDGPTPVVINASSLTLTSTSNLDLAIFGTPASGNYDYVSLGSGSASLAGKLNIRFINYVPSNNQTYTVVKTTGSVSGSFASVASNLSDVSFTQSELAGTGYQILIQSSGLPQVFATTALSGNQAQVANYFNNLSNQGKIPQSVINPITAMSFLPAPELAGYLQALSPQDYAQLSQTAIDHMIFEQISVDGQVYDAFHGGGFDTSGLALLKTSQSDPFALNLDAAMQQADHQAMLGQSMQEFDAGGMTPPVHQTHLSTRWSGFLTGQIALDSAPQGGYPTQHFTTGSVMAGIDYRLTRHLLVGGLFNYSYTGGTLDNLGSREAANSYAPGLFAGYKLGGLQIDGLTQYTFNDYKIDRNIVLPGYQGVATGEPTSNQYDAALMADYYLHPCKGVDIGPSGGIGYTHMNIGGFTETGSPYALTTSKQSVDSFRTLLGFQGHWHLNKTLVRMPLVVSFNAFWQHEYIGRRGALVSTFSQIGPGSFLYNAPSPSRNSAILGIGIGGYLTKNTSLFVNYQTQIGDHRQFAQTVMAGLAVGF